MKYVKMLKDVAEGNVVLELETVVLNGEKVTRPKNRKARLKVVKHRGAHIPLRKGAVLPMDDGGATKFVQRGLGREVSEAEFLKQKGE